MRKALLDAASKIVREEGVRSLNVAQVLNRAQLSTRAFYRHFDSKDAVGVGRVPGNGARGDEATETEDGRSRRPDRQAVVAWIDGRLDLAFNDQIRSDLRQMSLEAQSQMFASPEAGERRLRRDPETACRTTRARKAHSACFPTSTRPPMRCRFTA